MSRLDEVDDRLGDDRRASLARGRTFDAALTVITKQPPEHFDFRAEDVSGTLRHRFDVTATNDGCRVTRTVTPVHLSPGRQALYWLVLYPVKQPALKKSLQQLATLY